MISPSINDLTEGKFNRYTLCIATAKCARMITDEYVKQREIAEHRIANKETDKNLAAMISRDYRDEKAVKVAINKMYNKDFVVCGYTDGTDNAEAADEIGSDEEQTAEDTENNEEAVSE